MPHRESINLRPLGYFLPHRLNSEIVSEVLTHSGLECRPLQDLDDLRRHLRRESLRPRFVVIEDGEPNGFPWRVTAVCPELKSMAGHSQLPIIVLTLRWSDEWEDEVKGAGAADLMVIDDIYRRPTEGDEDGTMLSIRIRERLDEATLQRS